MRQLMLLMILVDLSAGVFVFLRLAYRLTRGFELCEGRGRLLDSRFGSLVPME